MALQMNPDYTRQLERLIVVLSNRELIPTWMISLVGVLIGALLTLLLGIWKERYETKRRKHRLERAICVELLFNHLSALAILEIHSGSHLTKPFAEAFTFEALEAAKFHGDIMYEIPHFPVMRILYRLYEILSRLRDPEPQTEALAKNAVKLFETDFAKGKLNQQLFIALAEDLGPTLKSRLVSLMNGTAEPQQ